MTTDATAAEQCPDWLTAYRDMPVDDALERVSFLVRGRAEVLDPSRLTELVAECAASYATTDEILAEQLAGVLDGVREFAASGNRASLGSAVFCAEQFAEDSRE